MWEGFWLIGVCFPKLLGEWIWLHFFEGIEAAASFDPTASVFFGQ